MDEACATPRACSSRPSAAKRGFALEGQVEPISKRGRAEMLREGSVESASTQMGPAAAAAVVGVPAGPAASACGSAYFEHSSADSHHSRQVDMSDAGGMYDPGDYFPSPTSHATAAAAAAAMSEDAAASKAGQQQELLTTSYLAELAAASETLKRLPLPGGQRYWPVHQSCALLPLCAAYEISPAAVALGASYFQRLLAHSDDLSGSAMSAGYFSAQQQPGAARGCLEWVMHAQPGTPDLLSILCTCVYLGAKMTEGPKYFRQLSAMLGHALHRAVPTEQATTLEMRILAKLDWRLGPYCCATGV